MIKSGNTVYLETGDCVTARSIANLIIALTPPIVAGIVITAQGGTIQIGENIQQQIEPATNASIIFDGVLFSNCTFIGNNTTLIFNNYGQAFSAVTFVGSFKADFLCPEFFGAKGDGTTDDKNALQACMSAAVTTKIYRMRLLPKTYLTTGTLYYKGNLSIEGTYHYNNYHHFGSKILVQMPENDKFHYAFDADCYILNEQDPELSNERFSPLAVFNSRSNNIYYKNDGELPSFQYAAPIHIKDVAIETDNKTFGGIRAIGINNGLIEGCSIFGFKLGIALSKGWNFKVERTQIRVGMWGMYLGGEITDGLFNDVQCVRDSHFIDSPVSVNDQAFFDNLFVNDNNNGFRDYRKIIGENIPAKSIGIICSSVNATINSCSTESFNVGCVCQSTNIVFNTPYMEYLTDNIAVLCKGNLTFNNMVGAQGYIAQNAYVATSMQAKIVLNNCHAGSFYPTYSFSNNSDHPIHTTDDYNRYYYNHKAYVVNNHNKVSKPLTYVKLRDLETYGENNDGSYIESSYIDYNVGDTLYVREYYYQDFIDPEIVEPTEEDIEAAMAQAEAANTARDKNYGDYYLNPITLKAALERIKDDYNYRNVKYIVILSNYSVDETLFWQSDHRIIIQRDRRARTLTLNQPQDLCCNVTFRNMTLRLNSSLSQAYGCASQEIRFEGCNISLLGNDVYLVDNTGALPTGHGFSKNVSIYLSSPLSPASYYRNTWNTGHDATRFVVDVNGTYTAGGY